MSTAAPRNLWFLNGSVSIVLAQADNADRVSVIHQHMPYGDSPPDHVHHGEDEIFHVTEGELTFRIRGATRTARAGETVLAPRDVPHGFSVTSPEGARFLTITRGGFENMVRDMARPAETDGLPPFAIPSPEMQGLLAARCAANGITLLGPAAPPR